MPTTNVIVDVIQNYSDMLQQLDQSIQRIGREWIELDENIYQYMSLKGMIYGDRGQGGSNYNSRDLLDLLSAVKKKETEYEAELKESLLDLIKQRDDIRRIHLCYMVLPYIEHEVLRLLYEENLTWGRVSEKLDISISTLSRKRDKALNMIHTAYSSDLSTTEVLQLQKVRKGIDWKYLLKK